MNLEIFDSNPRPNDNNQDVWSFVSQQIFARSANDCASKSIENSEAGAVISGDLSASERQVASRLSSAIRSGNQREADKIIEQYKEWPRALTRIVAQVNSEVKDQSKGTVIVLSYYDRNEIVSEKGSYTRRANEAWDGKSGFLVWHYASWEDDTRPRQPTRLPDGRIVPPKEQVMRTYSKTPIRIAKTSAYTENANDVNEPFKYTEEDLGRPLMLP